MRKFLFKVNALKSFLILLLALPLLVIGVQLGYQLFIQAKGIPANIVIDTQVTIEPLTNNWNSYAQGGEESADMIGPILSQVKQLAPNYIRIDHLYDHFDVVSRASNGQLTYNFSRLDTLVNSILQTGAKPFFSLSYMPPAIAENGDITGLPREWNEWAQVIKATIEHYSGRSNFNLTDIYYEVWNEPDLFGNWKVYGNKNYLTLYSYANQGANQAQNTNRFFLGGPATTQLYKNWIIAMAKHVVNNNLRFDFYSWHRYHLDPNQYANDAKDVTDWLFEYPQVVTIPRLITEWGFDSEINSGYDNQFAAAHAMATIRQTLQGYQHLFAFELVDGPSPDNQPFWGRWGLLTHPQHGTKLKPRYQVFKLMQELTGDRLLLTGEGTWVTGISTKDKDQIKVILINFDQHGRHAELVPLTFNKIDNGQYQFSQTRLGKTKTTQEIEITGNTYSTQVIMPASEVIFLELEKKPL